MVCILWAVSFRFSLLLIHAFFVTSGGTLAPPSVVLDTTLPMVNQYIFGPNEMAFDRISSFGSAFNYIRLATT